MSELQEQPVKPVIPAAAAKRANASVIGMILALAVSILAFLPVVLMNPAPDSDGFVSTVDVNGTAANAAGVAGFTPATPDTGGSYRSNYARWESGTSDGVPTWEVGYLTPAGSFIGLVQTRAANPTWLAQVTTNAPVTGTRDAGGQAWEIRDTGQGEKNLILNHRGTTVVLSGPASLDEFGTLASAVVVSMDAAPDVTVSSTAGATP
ncbi:DUF4245 domain-containing protein [Pseudarthrobacter sp. J75]|uniref:DUF4245 domain-containing protein n=1 Tax=unclassified Pseudarthrobacter TaxID=2647000 RepID=UPI002E815490|nr:MULTISPECIES: DUF4245 domain-containing protein [unclassified Pseudarthrobacter]MEE2521624.1 DUF4245 domain-containing protein [Pseudarthrobacter sp. J47]MEE2527701.1 DUF4245 domain-containing protein [Pseudarthrobacter sp. J75]MEE2570906.1 DUF4245 domain-containing protein [Pseudarthrobacter sp. J64]